MPAADVCLPRGFPARARLHAGALSLLWLAACGSGEAGAPTVTDDDGIGDQYCDTSCDIDASVSFANAFDAALGGDLADTLCPTGDVDYWRFQVPTGSDLVSVDVTYVKLASMQLRAEWYGPKGACVPSPATSCDDPGDCDSDETCDTLRGGCRRNAPDETCVDDGDCQGGESCVHVDNTLLADLDEGGGSGTTHRIVANLAAPVTNRDYILRVFDATAAVCDTTVSYDLEVTAADDPDGREPNDAPNLASALSGTPVTAYLSHRGRGDNQAQPERESDVDWYVIDTGGAARPVVTVDLRWPEAAQIAPTFTLIQGDWTAPSTSVRTEGSGAAAVRVRQSRLVTPATSPIYVKVTNTVASYDTSRAYTLTVSVANDPSEAGGADDAPTQAQPLTLGATGGATVNDGGTLVATNDVDWYRIDKPASPDENSLLHVVASANSPDITQYALQLSFFTPTAVACSVAGTCANGGQCLTSNNTCLASFTVRPSIDQLPGAGPTHGDPNRGGLTPNQITTQLPLFGTGNGVLYLQVRHYAPSLTLPGYHSTEAYTLALSHKAEPDIIERTTPDNLFLSRPLDSNDEDDFRLDPRDFTSTTEAGGSGGTSFATLAANSAATASACTTLTIEAFDADGSAASGATVNLGGSGTFYDSCGTMGLITQTTVTTSATVGYVAPAADNDNTISLTSGAAATQYLSSRSGALQAVRVLTATGGAPPRSLTPASSTRLRLTLPAAATSTRVLELDATNATVACYTSGGSCPGLSGLGGACGTTLGASSSCNVQVASGGSAYDIVISPSGAGLVRLDVRDVAEVAGNATYVASASTARSQSNTVSITGYISYEGDNDFFRIPIVPSTFANGHVTIYASYPASAVDLRANILRGDRGAGVANANDLVDVDMCVGGNCLDRGSCDGRDLCSHASAFNASAGPLAASPGCVYLNSSDTFLEVIVNDVNHNDFDEAALYQIDFDLVEGCAAACSVADCQ